MEVHVTVEGRLVKLLNGPLKPYLLRLKYKDRELYDYILAKLA